MREDGVSCESGGGVGAQRLAVTWGGSGMFLFASLLSPSPYLVPRLVAHDDKQGACVGGDAMLHEGADL